MLCYNSIETMSGIRLSRVFLHKMEEISHLKDNTGLSDMKYGIRTCYLQFAPGFSLQIFMVQP